MPADSQEPAEYQTATIELTMSGRKLRMELSVATAPTRLTHLLPLFRSLSDAFVSGAVSAVEATGEKISCCRKCAFCCRHLVALEETEAYRIAELVNEMPEPRRSGVRVRFKAALAIVESEGLLSRMLEMEKIERKDFLPFTLEYYAHKIDCPFLEDESCSIYAERPFVCREYLVASPAENCAKMTLSTATSVRGVNIDADVAKAISQVEGNGTARPRKRVPLLLALDWVEAHPDNSPKRPGMELMREFFTQLTGTEVPEEDGQNRRGLAKVES